MKLLTISEIRTYRRCPLEHHYRYDWGYRAIDRSNALRFGTLMHAALDAWWTRSDPSERLEAAGNVLVEGDPFELQKAIVMIWAYHLRWRKEPLRTIGTELEFRCPLVNPDTGFSSKTFELGGKLDKIAADANDIYWIVEHKTASGDIGIGSDYWAMLQLDNQISTYFVGARVLGYSPAGCLYDVLGKPAHRPGQVPLLDPDGVKIVVDSAGNRVRTKDGKRWRQTADSDSGCVLQTRDETPEEYGLRLREAIADNAARYLVRGEIVRLIEEERSAAWDNWTTAKQILASHNAKQWPRNSNVCIRWGSKCDFWPVCTGTASLDDTEKFKKLDEPHEELSVVNQ